MNRVVITGMGIVSAIAEDYPTWIMALRKKENKIAPFTLFSHSKNYPAGVVAKNKYNTPYRTLSLASIAFEQAINMSGDLQVPQEQIGISFSSSTIGMPELETNFIAMKKLENTNFSYTNALSVGLFSTYLGADRIKGSATSFSTACSSSANALGYAFLQVQQGVNKAVVAGGADALCRLTYYGFQSLKVMSLEPCSPFDKNRKGMNLGEGAGFVVLESLDNALKRKAKIYGEILGVGMSADGYHMSAPDPTGKGASLAMKRALQSAQISPNKIQCISAHGTGTIHNDVMESIAINNTFGEHTENIYVHGLKSYLGHTLGAAGILATISAISTMQHNFIPPTLRLKNLDPKCCLRMVPEDGIEKSISYSMINAFAFGGNNTSVIIGKY